MRTLHNGSHGFFISSEGWSEMLEKYRLFGAPESLSAPRNADHGLVKRAAGMRKSLV
jgi:hypothetical protein